MFSCKSKIFFCSLIVSFLISFSGSGFESSDVVKDKCDKKPVEADCSAFRAQGAGQAKNIILLIGDGMGINQVVAGRIYADGPDEPLPFEKLPHHGTLTTCSMSGITDSAAAATALATGHKTQNTYVAMTKDGTELKSILDQVHSTKWTGLVSTTQIWDATPAAFAAHDMQRSKAREIIGDYLETQPEVILGGGRMFWQAGEEYPDRIEAAKKQGYTYVSNAEELGKLDLTKVHKLLGLFADKEMEYEALRPANSTEPHLEQMAAAALKILSQNPGGFFLMIEGANIDHAGHAANIKNNVHETAEFSKTVDLVLEFAQKIPDTLVLVTADHETGGLDIKPGDYHKGDIANVHWGTAILPGIASHSSQRVPIYGIGPNSAAIKETQDNTAVYCIMKNAAP